MASNDCGKTWSVRKVIQYGQLSTAPNQNNFIPQQDEWRQAVVSSILGPYCVENFRFKFEFKSGGGNNLFIDDLNISYENTTDLDENKINDISLYPNPASELLHIKSSKPINKIKIYDVTGKLILTKRLASKTKAKLEIISLNKGFYTAIISDDYTDKALRFIKD